MDKKKLIGAAMIFIGAFMATRILLSKEGWNTSDYIQIVSACVLMILGLYVTTRKN